MKTFTTQPWHHLPSNILGNRDPTFSIETPIAKDFLRGFYEFSLKEISTRVRGWKVTSIPISSTQFSVDGWSDVVVSNWEGKGVWSPSRFSTSHPTRQVTAVRPRKPYSREWFVVWRYCFPLNRQTRRDSESFFIENSYRPQNSL